MLSVGIVAVNVYARTTFDRPGERPGVFAAAENAAEVGHLPHTIHPRKQKRPTKAKKASAHEGCGSMWSNSGPRMCIGHSS